MDEPDDLAVQNEIREQIRRLLGRTAGRADRIEPKPDVPKRGDKELREARKRKRKSRKKDRRRLR